MQIIAPNIDSRSAKGAGQCSEENKLDVHALRGLGQIARKRGDHQAALAHFESAAAENPADLWISWDISLELQYLNRLQDAEAACREILARDPTFSPALRGLGQIARKRGDHRAALAHFQAASTKNPADLWISWDISLELQTLNRLEDAEAACREILARNPTFSPALRGLGQIARKRGDHRAAKTMQTIAANIDCGSAERAGQCAEENKLDVRELRGLGKGDRLASLAAFEAAAAIDPDHNGVQLEIANDLRELGRLGDAEAILQRLIARDPNNTSPLIGLGHLKRRQGDRLASLAAFEAAAAIDPNHNGVQLEIANDLRELGRLGDAEAILQRLIARDPNNTSPLIGLGHLKRRQGDRLASLAAFEAAAEIYPDHNGVQLEIANDLRELGRLGDAEAILQRLIAKDPNNNSPLIGLGHLKRRQGDRLASLAAFEAAAAIDPDHNGVQLEIANDLRELGRLGDAEAILQRLIARDPNNTSPLIGLGHLKRRQGDRLASLAAFEAAAAIDPNHNGVQLEIANDLRELGRLGDAEAILQRLIARDPNNNSPLIGLGHLKRRQGDRSASLAAFEAAAAIDPDHIDVQLEIANDLRGLGNFVKAERQLEQILIASPNDVSAICALTSYLIAFDRLDEAYALCKDAHEREQHCSAIHLMLGYIARQQGNRHQALSCFTSAHKIDPNSNAIFEIAAEYRELGDFAKAHRILDSIIQETPLLLTALLQKGQIFRRQCARQAASEIFRRALEIHPESVQARVELAVELRALGQPRNSLEQLLCALTTEPTHFGALEQTNEHFWAADEIENSLELCKGWIDFHPYHPTPFVRASRALFELGRADDAFALLKTATERLRQHPEIQATKIDGFRRLRDWNAAKEILKECGSRSTNNFLLWTKRVQLSIDCGSYLTAEHALVSARASTLHEISRIKMFKGQIAEARWQLEASANHYREALEANADDAGAHAELARACLKLLDVDAARYHLRRQKEIQTAENVLRGISLNLSQTHTGQLIDEFSIDQQLLETLREIRMLASDQQVALLKRVIRENPEHTPSSIMLMIALKQAGELDFSRSIRPHNVIHPRIPARIIQYWDATEPPEEISELMRTWRTHHPDFEYLLFNDQTAQQFIRRHHHGAVYSAYLRAGEPAQRADIFRLAYLSVHGGVYADADDRCLESVNTFVPGDISFAAYQEDFGTLGNNFLAVEAGHPVIQHSLELATEAINRGDSDFLWLATGPGLLTRAFAQYVASTTDDWSKSTAIFDMGELQSHIGIHCQVRYKRTKKHWSRTSFQRKSNRDTKYTEDQILGILREHTLRMKNAAPGI
jgi:tetratricopeptide (TPR) repeat protein